MSLRNLGNTELGLKRLSSNYIYQTEFAIPATTWQPNPLWPTITEPASDGSEDKFVGLYAVFFDRAIDGTGGLIAVQANTSSGTWTVDWGDGTSDAANSSAAGVYHEYDVDNASLYDAAVTFTDVGDLVTRNGHHYTNGDKVRFYNIQSTTGLTEAIPYYVINATTNTFQVSTTQGGSAVALTTDGAASLLPYKVATVTITPDTGSITRLDAGLAHTSWSNNSYGYDWLDCVFSHPSCTQLVFARPSYTLERIKVITCATQTTNPNQLFNGHQKLKWIECPEDMYANTTSFASAFASCLSLEVAPYLNTSNGTNFTNMFNSCASLITVPAYDTSSVTTMNNMFSSCNSLLTVPFFNTSNVTDFYRMFYNCYSLKSVQTFDTSKATSVLQMFFSCYSLDKVQSEFDLSLCTTALQMFNNANSLRGSVTLKNCANLTTLNAAFSNAYSIGSVTIEGLTTQLTGSALYSTFLNCNYLREITFINCDTSLNQSCYAMYLSCYNLRRAPDMDTSSVTNMQNMHYNNQNLEEVPAYNTVNVTTMRSMLSGCLSLKTIPAFDLTSCTDLRSFIQGSDLEALPYMDTSGVTDFGSMVSGNRKLRIIPAYNMNSASNSSNTQMWGINASLSRIKTTGMKYTFNISYTALNSAELDEVYSNLATVTGQTITVTSCRGTAGDNPSIATAKGWTVVG